ncbi:MAG: aminoglycoside phosphotransferase family protein [Acidimicrobiia bacterium]|nr:aminoglycoside phosphotransferase family protein [Acidimicrobiia bacterium]
MNMVSVDNALPIFHRTWEPSSMAETIDRLVERDWGWKTIDLRLERIRHRLGVRGTVQYTAVFESRDIRQEVWLAGTTYADGRAAGVARKLRTAAARAVPPLKSLVAFDPVHDMVFQVFPLDHKLPGALAFACRDELSRWVPGEATLTPVRHRIGLSATLRTVLRSEISYVKFHRADEAHRSAARSKQLQRLSPENIGLAVPRAVIPDLEATITDAAAGSRLDVLAGMGDERAMAVVAEALLGLHRSNADGLDDRSLVPKVRVRRSVEWLKFVMPEAGPMMDRLLDGPKPTEGEALVHGDLKPDHVFVDGDRVNLIDLDSAGRGRPLSDLATLAVRLPFEQQALLIEHYHRLAPRADWSAWRPEVAMASIKLALSHAQHRQAGWPRAVWQALLATDALCRQGSPAGNSSCRGL